MAAEDFEIKIRITADTAQVAQIQQAFTQIGAQVETLKAKAGAAGATPADATQAANVIGGLIGRLGAGAAVYGLIDHIKEAAVHIEKMTEQLDKQGALLIENAQHYHEQAQAATTEADVLKIAEGALKNIAAARKQAADAAKEELGWMDKIIDSVTKTARSGFTADPTRFLQKGPLEEALKLRQAEAAEIQKSEDALARRAIQESTEYKERADQLKALPFEEAFSKISTEIDELTSKQESLDQNAADYVKKYVDLGHQLETDQKLLAALTNQERERQREAQATAQEHEKDVDFWAKQVQRAPPQVQAVLKQEQAARAARAEGRERDAELFEKSAEAFKRGATPQQLEQLKTLEGSKDIVDAINRLADLWK